jgi:TPR repeat protein
MVVQSGKMAEDEEQWVKILKRLADMGNHKAMIRLAGKMIISSETMPFYDPDEGFRLLITAARAGDAQAQWRLACWLIRDPYLSTISFTLRQEQFRWYYAAAEQGYAQAQLDLGKMLNGGGAPDRNNQFRITPEDCIEAYKWLTLAIKRFTAVPIEKGSIYAEWNGYVLSSRKGMVKKSFISEAQIEEALKRVAAWEKSHPHAYKKFPFNELD